MPPDPAVLDSIAALHREVLDAAHAADAAAVAAGRVLLELKHGMRAQGWRDFLASPECSVSRAMVGTYMQAAHAADARERRGRDAAGWR